MGDGAVGLAVAHRRTVGTARRVHQDCRLAVERRAARRFASRRRLACAGACASPKPASSRKARICRDALDARSKRAVADEAGIADLGAELRRQREGDVEAVGRQESGGAVGPFHQHHGAVGQIVEAEFGELGRARQPVEIGMNEREARQLVALHQSEGRARHLDRVVAREVADQRARESGLAGAEVARQRHEIAGLERGGDVGREPRPSPARSAMSR